jgi:hypothetical protein
VVRRKTNRRHMTGDHQGREAESNSAGQGNGRGPRHPQATGLGDPQRLPSFLAMRPTKKRVAVSIFNLAIPINGV